ncbi:Uma2 family endonuclease [Amycolatopsis jejuensis]|uniref:Uma2 family endonuclease n=1 Tax=Amycolatopsis jejuensis TaxID=330084 RepID=UPI0005264DCF|nr:Uma2 family endonuclease [Amycolatopsis jejuensis]
MSALEWPQHLLTFDDWTALPVDRRARIEVVEGVPSVSPRPMWFHLRSVTRLAFLLDEQLCPSMSAGAEAELVLVKSPPTVRIPDVVVTSASVAEANPARIAAADALLVIEVLSESTKQVDQVTKHFEYAEAGIEHYWIVDLDPPVSMITYRLIDGEYENFGEHSGSVVLDFAGTSVKLDLDALVDPRAQR